MPDLLSVVPAPRFAATVGNYLINIWNPRKIFFEKSSGQNHPLGPKGEPLPWGSQCVAGVFSNTLEEKNELSHSWSRSLSFW